MVKRSFTATLLDLPNPEEGLSVHNHILEPEYHQAIYVDACRAASKAAGAFSLGQPGLLGRPIGRGRQPAYADDDGDPSSLEYEGMMTQTGTRLEDKKKTGNVCALKSASIRRGFVDFDLARSVTREFYDRNSARAGVKAGDLLINSTGDGTIGRAAVYNHEFPALVDGHITIVRFTNPDLAWYTAAYLLSDGGQKQIYRYINGSSGQVEIYPQDIARLWVPGATATNVKAIAKTLKSACEKHDQFFTDMTKALSSF